MRNLSKVINQLTEKEIKLVDSFFELNSNRNNSKKKELFNLIQRKNNSKNEALKKIYDFHHPDGVAGRTAERLMNDLCSAMLFGGEDLCKRGNLRDELKCKRQIIVAEILFRRQLYMEAGQFLLKAMKIAKVSEFYSEQIAIYHNYMSGFAFYNDISLIINTDIQLIGDLHKGVSDCERLYQEIRQTWYSGVQLSKGRLKKWEDNLIAAGENTITNDSVRISYSTGWMRIFIAVYKGDCHGGLKAIEGVFRILNGSKIFNYEKLLLPAYTVFAMFNFKNGNEPAGINYLDKIKPDEIPLYLADDPFSLENIFLSALHSGEEKKAAVALDTALKSFLIRSNDFLRFKWLFFDAVYRFHKKEFKAAILLMENLRFLKRKKTALEIYTYVVLVMMKVDAGRQNEFSLNSASWQKLLYRNSKSLAKTEPRLSAILKILKTLFSSGFNFEKTFRREKEFIQLLNEGKGKYKFAFGGFEVARFDSWMESNYKVQ